MTPRPISWRAAAVLLIALMGLGLGNALGTKPVEPPHPHAAPILVAPGHTLPSVAAEHPHLRVSASTDAPDLVATAGLPRSASTLLALGLAVALGVIVSHWRALTLEAGRSPPQQAVPVRTGRAVLTRLCISRR
ncbi:hypothetical protein [Mycolicibacterium sp. CBMA 234]|uniref:hypothetical protein n=1 Tax=Mycolicibacterium sp. CBMA 234 TaxID=1918495 RepID=UPI0012DEDB5F|nr:hypothetical protein [Mycolicibacterium sp. CBMA 234]